MRYSKYQFIVHNTPTMPKFISKNKICCIFSIFCIFWIFLYFVSDVFVTTENHFLAHKRAERAENCDSCCGHVEVKYLSHSLPGLFPCRSLLLCPRIHLYTNTYLCIQYTQNMQNIHDYITNIMIQTLYRNSKVRTVSTFSFFLVFYDFPKTCFCVIVSVS